MKKKLPPAPAVPPVKTVQRVNIDFPVDILAAIDAQCSRLGVPRQSWIKMQLGKLIDEKGASV